MRRHAALIGVMAMVAALAGTGPSPVGAQAVTDQVFAGYGSGATISLSALQLGQTQAVNVQAAAAGQSTFSQGLPGAGLFNELGYIVQPAGTPGNAFGRGTGLELGLLTPDPNPDPNQILLSGLATANAPPSSGLIEREIGPISLGGLAYASLLKGSAQATFNPNFCPVGRPLSFGQGEATGLQLVGSENGGGPLNNPLVGSSLPVDSNDPRNVSRTRSFTYLIPNGDGTFGVVSETRQTIAPVSLLGGAITLELLGEWALRAIATGKPGPDGARVEYAPVGAGPTTPVVSLTIGGLPTVITAQQLFGPGGFDTGPLLGALSGLVELTIGTPARQLGGNGPVTDAADGTAAAGAVDVVTLKVLNLPPLLVGTNLAIGHMEAAASAPAGGVTCEIPVSKSATPNPVVAGNDFTVTIRIPSDSGLFTELFACDLVSIRVTDEHAIESGNPSFVLTSASDGGVIGADGSTVTWDNIGNYTPGDPPIELTVRGRIPGNSGDGVLRDTANVSASLGNCEGTGEGDEVVGSVINTLSNNATIGGSITLIGPNVSRSGVLAATGGDQGLLVLGGALLLGAVVLRRTLRPRAVRARARH